MKNVIDIATREQNSANIGELQEAELGEHLFFVKVEEPFSSVNQPNHLAS